MRVLFLFIDALRANRLAAFNPDIAQPTLFDNYLHRNGFTVYRNCFTPCPDTYRSLAALMTGIEPWESACNCYNKPLNPYGLQYKTIFDCLNERGFSFSLFHSHSEPFVFPPFIQKYLYDGCVLSDFIKQVPSHDNHFTWIGLLDFRKASYFTKYNARKEPFWFQRLDKALSNLETSFLDSYDHVFLFSDHGVMLSNDIKKVDGVPYPFLSENRTQLVMAHHVKGQRETLFRDKLCSMTDIFPTLLHILDGKEDKNSSGFSLLSDKCREFVMVEDVDYTSIDIFSFPRYFSLVRNENIYLRFFRDNISLNLSSLGNDQACLVDRKSRKSSIMAPNATWDALMAKTNKHFADCLECFSLWNGIHHHRMQYKKRTGCPAEGEYFSDGSIIKPIQKWYYPLKRLFKR